MADKSIRCDSSWLLWRARFAFDGKICCWLMVIGIGTIHSWPVRADAAGDSDALPGSGDFIAQPSGLAS